LIYGPSYGHSGSGYFLLEDVVDSLYNKKGTIKQGFDIGGYISVIDRGTEQDLVCFKHFF
jgi:hypothetical protein